MPFSLSPSVLVTETDLTNLVPTVSTSTGATVGQFLWGPVNEITTVDNEEELVSIFGQPTNTFYLDFFSCANFLAYASNLQIVRVIDVATAKNANATASTGSTGRLVQNTDTYNSLSLGSAADLWIAKYPGALGNAIGVAWANGTGFDASDSNGDYLWPYQGLFTSTPATNEFHIVVYDATGDITGTVGTVLETYPFVSTVSTDIYYDGTSAYFLNRINSGSSWLWVGNPSLLTGTENGVVLAGGIDGAAVTDGDREAGFALFLDTEAVDVSLVFAGGAGPNASQYIIQDLAEVRKDCVAFVSPMQSDCVNIFDLTTILNNTLNRATGYGSSSYAVMDSAWKWMFDRYNNVNRWVPLNGDIAGLCARVDATNDPWFSPGGYNRGLIQNVIKFSHPQQKSFRDAIYSKGINPCFIDRVDGAVMLGDKTLLARPSEFGFIGVRRMFITVEKAIASACKYLLMEQNNDQTRARFVNLVTPYLRDVEGRQGIQDFAVVCDTTNNTTDTIAAGQLIGTIWIVPVTSVNVIQLNFNATTSSTDFDEIVQSPSSSS